MAVQLWLTNSKSLQREINNLFNEKELKVNTLRSLGEELNRKSMRLTDLRAKQERRKLDEQQLKEQQGQLTKLQRELKVSLNEGVVCGRGVTHDLLS